MKTLNLIQVVAVLAIAVALTNCTHTGATGEFHPRNDPWWTQEPVYGKNGQIVGYRPEDNDLGVENLVGQGDGEEPAACANGQQSADDGTCLAGSTQRSFAQGDPTGRYYRPLTPSGR